MRHACTAFSLRGNVIQSEKDCRGHTLYAAHERATCAHNIHLDLILNTQIDPIKKAFKYKVRALQASKEMLLELMQKD